MNKVNVRAYCIRPILAAGIALAIAFTFSACSNGDDGGDGDSSSSGEVGLPSSSSSSAAGGTSSSSSSLSSSSSSSSEGASSPSGADNGEEAQVYIEEEQDSGIYTEYNGDGDIKIKVCDRDCSDEVSAGKIESGIVKLLSPLPNINAEYLFPISDGIGEGFGLPELPNECNVSEDVKVARAYFSANSIDNQSFSGSLGFFYNSDDWERIARVYYLYSSKAENISCDFEHEACDGGCLSPITIDLDLAQGWNKIHNVYTDESSTISTDESVLAPFLNDMKWIVSN